MRALFLWLGLGIGVSSGYLVGHEVEPNGGGVLGPLLWSALALVLVFSAVAASRVRAATRLWVVALLGLASLRGYQAARDDADAAWPAADRGPAQGLRVLEVVGASFTGQACEVAAREPNHGARVWLSAPAKVCPLVAGQRVAVLASTMVLAEGPRLPSGVDPRHMVRPKGVQLHLRVDALWTIEPGTSAYWAWVAEARHRAWRWTRGDDASSFVVASALGVRVALAPDRRAEIRRAGLGHLVAVSGLHVALAAWFVHAACLRLTALLGRPPSWGVVAAWLPLLAYVGLTGASAPAVRAAAMLVLFGLGTLLARPTHSTALLATAAASMLLVRPAWAFDPGFQLSLVAMVALVRAPPGTGVLGHSWRISWALVPICALHFDETGAYGVISNLVAIPVFTMWVLPCALAGWLLTPWLGPLALLPAARGAAIVLDVAAAVAALPPISLGVTAWVAGCGLLVRLATSKWRKMARVRPMLPPVLASVATLAAWMVPRSTVDPGPWFAVGTPRSHALVALALDTDGSRIACLRGSTLGPAAWLQLFGALGIVRVAAVENERAAQSEDAPHIAALRKALKHERRWGGDPAACRYPAAQDVQRAIELCTRRIGGGRAFVLGSNDDSPLRCFLAGRYVPLPSNEVDRTKTFTRQ